MSGCRNGGRDVPEVIRGRALFSDGAGLPFSYVGGREIVGFEVSQGGATELFAPAREVTAERVRELHERNWHIELRDGRTVGRTDWQAIADALNGKGE